MERLRILFLAADPGSMGQVNAGREAREIREKLRVAAHRDAIELFERFAVRPGDLQQTFFEVRPHVVHFSGHGTPDEELVLEGDDGGAEPLGKRALTELFRVHKDTIRLVVLSACHSRPQVDAISEHVECAIGMRRAVGSRAATEFSAAFYLAVGFGSSVAMAFESGIAELRARGIPEDRTPQLVVRPGTDATRVILLDGAAADRTAAATTAPPQIAIARLPATGRELFGREKELAWLDACWQEGVRVASIVAFGGVGKSTLVNAWLARMDADGWRGAERVYGWSFYSQGTDRLGSSDEFVAKALEELGDPDPTRGSPWDKGERLAKLVRKERMIVVLDGVEPLQWGPGVQQGKLKDPALEALMKELAAQNRGICLITSRIAVTDLEGLGGDRVRSKDLGQLSPEAGAALLVARGAKGTDAELREASREYRGHGLALTLLGSYLADVAEGDIRRRRESGPLEAAEQQGAHARRVMAAYEGWLGKAEVAVLHIMGLFDRPVEEDELAALRAEPAVTGLTDALAGVGGRAWNQVVARLRRAGLLLSAEQEQDKRLDAHPLVREHFGEQLRRKQPEAWREGHRRLYGHLRRKAKELPDTIEEMAPLYAAVVHGCLAGKNQEALDQVWWKRVYRENQHFNWKKLGAFGSEAAVLSAFFDPPWERLAPGLSEQDQGFVLNQASIALRALGRPSEAARLMRVSLEMGIAQQNWSEAARRASNLSGLLQSRGELGEALAQARKGVDLADASGDGLLRMLSRTTLAAALHPMGLREQAAAQFEEAERLQQEWQPAYPRLYSFAGFQHCDLLLDQGRDAEAREHAEELFAWRVPGDPLLSVALDHLSLGRAHLLAVQRCAATYLAQAASHLAQAVDGLRRSGQQDYLPLGLLSRAALHTHTGAFADARRDIDEALALATRCGFRLHETDAHLAHARLSLAEDPPDPTAARAHLAAARALIAATGYHRRDAELEALTAQLAGSKGCAPRG